MQQPLADHFMLNNSVNLGGIKVGRQRVAVSMST